MKAHLLQIPNRVDSSFTFNQYSLPNINSRWHFHPELELIRIHKGFGTQFMGDSIKHFAAGDIVLVGSNLPHFWRYDEKALDIPLQEKNYSTVIHFTENLWGDHFLSLPENSILKYLFEKSKRGLLLQDKTQNKVAELIEKIKLAEGTYRLIYLLECLVTIARSENNVPLSSLGFAPSITNTEHERINAIYNYSFKHFLDRIPLEKIASEVGLVPSSFCRYFKSKTGRSFTQFILELRIGYASKLLIENRLPNKEVCYQSGFHNFTSFHKHFKAITGMSPKSYQKLFGA